jgi:hypothetical protein
MNQFLIKYRLVEGTSEEWHKTVAEFISSLDGDADLKDKISYRCMRAGADYYHLAAPADELAVKTLQQREYFKRYTEKTRQVAGGEVVVAPLEIVAETAHRA